MSELQQRLAQLSPAKRALLERRMTRASSAPVSRPTFIAPRIVSGPAPLSLEQEGIWLLQQLDPASPAGNRPSHLRLSGRLDVGALERALGAIVARHDALRSAFPVGPDGPIQESRPAAPLSLPLTDLAGLPIRERHKRARQLAEEHARQHFDLAAGPVFAASLLRLSENEHILLLTFHHIVFDGWSMQVLLRELADAYHGFVTAGAWNPPPLPIQYADYATWQRADLAPAVERQLEYWKRELADVPALELPADRPRRGSANGRSARVEMRFAPELGESLRRLGAGENATLFMSLLAGFALVLHEQTGQRDLPVGVPIAGRENLQTEDLIGVFVNTLVMRARLDERMTFRQLLARIRQTAVDAYAHAIVPPQRIRQALRRPGGADPISLFQVLFQLRNLPRSAVQLPDLTITEVPTGVGAAKADLAIDVIDKPGGLHCLADYDADLFDRRRISRMLARLEELLAAAAADPDQQLTRLLRRAPAPPPLPTDAISGLREVDPAAFLLKPVGGVADPASSGVSDASSSPALAKETIPQFFEAQARLHPDHIAIEGGERSLTYAQLNARANQLAHRLRRQGVAAEALVGLCMSRSPEMLVAMLAVAKAGGAYVPLDPAYPSQRLAMILDDCRPGVILTQPDVALPESPAEVITLDLSGRSFENESDADLPPLATGANLAYVIYTSGSTGRPKGVLIEHRSLVNYVQVAGEQYALGPVDRILQFCSISFDASVDEIWVPLARGASIVLRTEEMLQPRQFLAGCRDAGITAVSLPTAFWHELTAAMVEERLPWPPNVRLVVIGGERASAQRLGQWLKHVGRAVRLVNSYGPTEATVAVTTCELSAMPDDAADVPIGRPIPGVTAHLIDGELYLGGACLARGYLNRPEEMRCAFVPGPANPARRLYRTGDRVRQDADGMLWYVGRADEQVKIRGYRVELGEVEAAILSHPSVRQAAVIAAPGTDGQNRLVAYVALTPSPCTQGEGRGEGVRPEDEGNHAPRPPRERPHPNPLLEYRARGPEEIAASALRDFLKTTLPAPMIPATIVLLDSLPVGPSGKIDRRALPAPADAPAAPPTSAPGTPTEQALAAIWSQLLCVPSIGTTDSFFDLGGHSLLATRMISRVRDALNVELPLRAVFEHPTLAGLAARIDAQARPTTPQAPPIVRRLDPSAPAPLTFAQERLWFLEQLEPGTSAYHIPLMLRLTGRIDLAALQAALDAVVCRHESLRTGFVAPDGRPVQFVAPAAQLRLAQWDLASLPDDERHKRLRELTQAEGGRPFDLARPPLARAALLRLSEQEHILLLVIHHIVCDGWSVQLLFRDLGTAYAAAAHGNAPALPPLPIQYADFAQWQRQCLSDAALETELAGWKDRLAGIPPLLELPTDRPRPPVQTYRAQRQIHKLSPELSRAVTDLSHKLGATPYMTLLAAFDLLLGRLAGQDDVVVGCPVAGRTITQTEPLVGFFINTLALRSSLAGNPTFRQLVGRVRETTLWAHAHQSTPMEKIVGELNPQRTLSHTPLFQVMFTMLDMGGEPLRLDGLSAELLTAPDLGSKFDLTLYARDAAGATQLDLLYNADLFDAPRMAQMLEQLSSILHDAVASPDRPIDQFSLVTESAAQALPDPTYPLDGASAIDLMPRLAEQAARRAGHPAILDPAGTWTYQVVDDLSNRVAGAVRRSGIGRGDLVAIYGHRSAPLVVAMLGVLKAGAAFTILDPAYPGARLVECLRVARPAGWIGLAAAGIPQAALADFRASLQCRCQIKLGRSPDEIAAALPPAPMPLEALAPDDLMYVVFTSGTTGTPKAIEGTARPVAHFLDWHARTFGLSEADRFSLLSGLAHDPLLRDILAPLWLGATLCIPDPADLYEPARLTQWMQRERISVTHLTPAMSQLLCTAPDEMRLADLRWTFFGGDAVGGRDVAALRALAPQAQCANFYGTTETPQAMAWHPIPPAVQGIAPIGRGIDDAQLLVLSRAGQLCGIGELGEVHVRTPYLSRGYRDDPPLTRARFVSNPFTGRDDDRIYKTGDLGRYRADGAVELAGRSDQQVKIRGHRVELGEIESALARHPDVAECAAVITDEHQLAAAIVLRTEKWDSAELRRFLRSILPDFAIPAAFIPTAGLPLTPNGKLDRKAVAHLAAAAPRQHEAIEPRNMVESQIIAIFRQLLGVPSVDPRDNFFDLGGHSLLAVQLMERIRQSTGRTLPVATLFAEPTPEHLARQVLAQRPGQPDSPLFVVQASACSGPDRLTPEVRTESKPAPLFFVHGDIYGDGLYCANLARHLDPRRPFYALAPLAPDVGPRSIESIAAYYIRLIRAVRPRGPYLLGGFCNGGVIAFEMARQLCRAGESVPLVALVRTLPGGRRESALHRILAGVCAALSIAPDHRQRIFLRASGWLDTWRRVRQFGPAVALRLSARAIRRLLHRAWTGPAPIRHDYRDADERRHRTMALHCRAMSAYRPGPYPGRVVTFWPQEEQLLVDGDPSAGWGKAAERVEAHWVPGGHMTCLTQHLPDLAALLQRQIAETEA